MGLKIIAAPKFTVEVVVNTRHLKGSFTAEFVAMRTSELEKLQEDRIQKGDGAQGYLLDVCKGFQPVTLPDDSTLAYVGEVSVKMLLDYPGIGPAMSKAYHRALWEEAEGNSPQPPAGS